MKSCVASQLWVGGWLENVIRDIQKMQKELFCIPLCLQKYFSQFVACLWPLLAELKKQFHLLAASLQNLDLLVLVWETRKLIHLDL